MIFENFYVKAPVELLQKPIELEEFQREDGSYMTIPEYLAQFGHTVRRFSTDGTYFLKGFGFSLKGLDEIRAKMDEYGLQLGKNIWILSPAEVEEELKKPMWTGEDASGN